MADALENVARQLEESGIVSPSRLKEFLPPSANPQSVEELVSELVKQRQLTEFQAQQVAAGHAQNLILGNYTLLDKIGAGGMGQVFKAEHRRMHRVVALKTLPTSALKDEAAVARFQREVEAAAKLRHPHIVATDDADESGGIHFLVMEYVEGCNLFTLVRKHGPLKFSRALNYIWQAAKGLEFAHKKGVIHRDIKPGNLLLDTEGTVKVLDLGLARITPDGEAPTQTELTSAGAVIGTIDYMAPEQALNTRNADARADIYGLGCSLYFLMAGKSLYPGDSDLAKLMAHRENPIPSLRDLQSDIPEVVNLIFRKMVAKQVADRYQSMAELISDLEACGADQQRASDPAPLPALDSDPRHNTPTVTMQQRLLGQSSTVVERSKSRKKLWLVASSFAMVGAVIVTATILPKFDTQPPVTPKPETTQQVKPPQAVVETPVVQVDQDKTVAEWVLSHHGQVTVAWDYDRPPVTLTAGMALPSGRFKITNISLGPMIPSNDDLNTMLGMINGLAELDGLGLGRTTLTDEGLKKLSNLPKLTNLAALETTIGDEGLAWLTTFTGMRGLYLSGTAVTDEGMKHLAKFTFLVNLNLDQTKITDDGLAHLEGLTMLRTLSLDNTSIGNRGLQLLARQKKLVVLHLDGSKITNAGLAAFSDLPKLQDLSLSNTSITDAGLPGLEQLKELRSLRLSGSGVTPAGIAELKNALPKCTIE